MSNLYQPSLALLSKLASIAVHAAELRSEDGHQFDGVAIDSLLADPEVSGWLKLMGEAALAPLPRTAKTAIPADAGSAEPEA